MTDLVTEENKAKKSNLHEGILQQYNLTKKIYYFLSDTKSDWTSLKKTKVWQ